MTDLITTSGTISASILAEAAQILGGNRDAQNGPRERSFSATAGLWNAYLLARKDGGPISDVDVAQMLGLLKIARSLQGLPVRDHYVDQCGYAAIAGEIAIGVVA